MRASHTPPPIIDSYIVQVRQSEGWHKVHFACRESAENYIEHLKSTRPEVVQAVLVKLEPVVQVGAGFKRITYVIGKKLS